MKAKTIERGKKKTPCACHFCGAKNAGKAERHFCFSGEVSNFELVPKKERSFSIWLFLHGDHSTEELDATTYSGGCTLARIKGATFNAYFCSSACMITWFCQMVNRLEKTEAKHIRKHGGTVPVSKRDRGDDTAVVRQDAKQNSETIRMGEYDLPAECFHCKAKGEVGEPFRFLGVGGCAGGYHDLPLKKQRMKFELAVYSACRDMIADIRLPFARVDFNNNFCAFFCSYTCMREWFAGLVNQLEATAQKCFTLT